jgi:hypothetical protein
MSLSDGTIVVRVADNGRPVVSGGVGRGGNALSEVYPDLSDAATVGAVLGLVREAWGDAGAYCRYDKGYSDWILRMDHRGFTGATEAMALVCALEAAP